MKPKTVVILALVTNIIVGNVLLVKFDGSNATYIDILILHIITTIVALSIFVFIFKKISSKTKFYKVFLFSILGTFLVPVMTTYVFFAGLGIIQLNSNAWLNGIVFAVVAGIVSWKYWMPLSMLNLFFIMLYQKQKSK